MGVLKAMLLPFQIWNDTVLKIGRWIAIVAIALMVLAIDPSGPGPAEVRRSWSAAMRSYSTTGTSRPFWL